MTGIAHQARLDRCAELIAVVQEVRSTQEVEQLASMIAGHAEFVHKLEPVANMWPNHPDVAELIDLRDEITTKLEGISVAMSLQTTA